MKKMFLVGFLAVAATALSQQQASAWINARFSVGMNWQWQSGGNNFGWGAFRNGQPPGPEAFGGSFFPSYAAPAPAQGHGYTPMPQGSPMPQAANQTPSVFTTPYQFANYSRPVQNYVAPTYYYYYYPAPAYDPFFFGQ